MKKYVGLVLGVIVIIALMILPGFVMYIVGDIANRVLPDKKDQKGDNNGTDR